MKTFATLLLTGTLLMSASAQSVIVWDPVVTSTLVACHTAQQKQLREIKKNEAAILGAQLFISGQVKKIKELEEKLHNRLKVVTAIVQDGTNIMYARQVAEDIGKYQALMVRYARKNPALSLVAYETEAVLVARTADLLAYMASALVGGDVNLLDNRQRQELIEYAVSELRAMRGIAYAISNRMQMAARSRTPEFNNPFHLDYPEEDREISAKILSSL